MDAPRLLWTPDPATLQTCNLTAFTEWLKVAKGLQFEDYTALWTWSTTYTADFWACIAEYFEVIFHSAPVQILDSLSMPGVHWFQGATLNYAEHLFRHRHSGHPAIIAGSEVSPPVTISWESLEAKVAAVAQWLKNAGVTPGDRVAAYLPNIPEATIAMMATVAIGGVWSSCSPDFGVQSVVDRFAQIRPKVLIGIGGYHYAGKFFNRTEVVQSLQNQLPGLEYTLWVPAPNVDQQTPLGMVSWSEITETQNDGLQFTAVPFDHPLWVLYSSGTTGVPKAIVHSHGGNLLEHLKYGALHNDIRPGEVFFWYTTTGWMMWNYLHAALLAGATIVLYDGATAYPAKDHLWALAAETGMQHFGTSAPYLVYCMKEGLQPGKQHNLSRLRSIGSTGSPLPSEAFDYVYQDIHPQVWLCSMSGGTDICTAFVGSNPWWPVYAGEIQCRALGCALEAWDESGKPLMDEVGEMVVTRPMPSMPVAFWNDPDGEKYREAYFEHYPGVWRHGDWVRITPRQGLVILGRSDATLNRQGIRIGTAEIYRAVDQVPEIQDSLVIHLEVAGEVDFMPLFVVMKQGHPLTDAVRQTIKSTLRATYTPRHVPDQVLEVPAIPYTISGKKMETPVKKLLLGVAEEKAVNKGSMRNPESLEFFKTYASQWRIDAQIGTR